MFIFFFAGPIQARIDRDAIDDKFNCLRERI